MIPDIENIINGLLSGEYTKEQAMKWINAHISLAEFRARKESSHD